MSIKFRELIWLCKQKQKARSNQASISINSSSIELSKTKLFPVTNVKQKILFPFYIMFWYCDFQASLEKLWWKMKNGLYFPNQFEHCFVFSDLKSLYNFSQGQCGFSCWKLLFAVGGFFGILIINFIGWAIKLYKIDSYPTWYCILRKGWGWGVTLKREKSIII